LELKQLKRWGLKQYKNKNKWKINQNTQDNDLFLENHLNDADAMRMAVKCEKNGDE
jgi:hypothetical protein